MISWVIFAHCQFLACSCINFSSTGRGLSMNARKLWHTCLLGLLVFQSHEPGLIPERAAVFFCKESGASSFVQLKFPCWVVVALTVAVVELALLGQMPCRIARILVVLFALWCGCFWGLRCFITLKNLTSLNQDSRLFCLWGFPSFSSLSNYSIWRS